LRKKNNFFLGGFAFHCGRRGGGGGSNPLLVLEGVGPGWCIPSVD